MQDGVFVSYGPLARCERFSKSPLKSISGPPLNRSPRLSGPRAAFGSCFPQQTNPPAAKSILDVDRNARIGRNENDFPF